jgi:hypothetical protein
MGYESVSGDVCTREGLARTENSTHERDLLIHHVLPKIFSQLPLLLGPSVNPLSYGSVLDQRATGFERYGFRNGP